MSDKPAPPENPLDIITSPSYVYAQITETELGAEVDGIVSSIVFPDEKAYTRGFFKRFFIARYDSYKAIEVTEDFYKKKFKKLAKGLYKQHSIRWYLKDNLNFERKTLLKSLTAFNMNEDNVIVASKQMPQLLNTLKEFDQFV
tara:strand:+ start:330 stop:758 length:429 start_codon:yes stop_codon:yes gene_type:complete